MFVTDSGTAIPIANTLEILGGHIAAAGTPIFTEAPGATNIVTVNIQASSAQAASSAANMGGASFNNTEFTVDANGFVSLIGGGAAIDSIAVDSFTAPGTNPVVPTVDGLVTITGGQVAAGTVGANVIRTDSLTANTLTVEIQRSTTNATTDSSKNGVSHFDSAAFYVDANGFVQLNGGGIAATAFDVDAHTAPGTDPVVPNASGVVVVTGSSTTAGTVPVQTNSLAANTYAIQVQKSQAIASTNASNVGLAAFDSARFTVDGNGFVSANGSGIVETITGDSGGAVSPTTGNINILGGTTGLTFSGNTSTLTLNSPQLNLPDTTSSSIGVVNINGNRFIHKYGDVDNVFVGTNAGNFTNSTALANTGVGSGALSSLTTGDNNVAIGTNSLNALQSSINTIAIGQGAMKLAQTNASSTVAIGNNVFSSFVSGAGDTNVFIGASVALNWISSRFSTIIGPGAAGSGIGNNIQNTGLGYFCFRNLTTGSNNTAIGISTCNDLTTGSNNTALGEGALVFLLSGSYNIGVGSRSGSSYNSSESNNILINNVGTTGDNNKCRIGAGTGTGTKQLNATYISGIRGATLSAGSPTPYLTLTDTSNDQIVCPTPVQASSATTTYGQLAVGTALQNTANYPILVSVSMAVTAATTATITVGVGSTNTPTAQTVVPSFTVAAFTPFSFSFVVPAKFYALVNTTGTITVGSITTLATQIG